MLKKCHASPLLVRSSDMERIPPAKITTFTLRLS
jgi:hypothetical protein